MRFVCCPGHLLHLIGRRFKSYWAHLANSISVLMEFCFIRHVLGSSRKMKSMWSWS